MNFSSGQSTLQNASVTPSQPVTPQPVTPSQPDKPRPLTPAKKLTATRNKRIFGDYIWATMQRFIEHNVDDEQNVHEYDPLLPDPKNFQAVKNFYKNFKDATDEFVEKEGLERPDSFCGLKNIETGPEATKALEKFFGAGMSTGNRKNFYKNSYNFLFEKKRGPEDWNQEPIANDQALRHTNFYEGARYALGISFYAVAAFQDFLRQSKVVAPAIENLISDLDLYLLDSIKDLRNKDPYPIGTSLCGSPLCPEGYLNGIVQGTALCLTMLQFNLKESEEIQKKLPADKAEHLDAFLQKCNERKLTEEDLK